MITRYNIETKIKIMFIWSNTYNFFIQQFLNKICKNCLFTLMLLILIKFCQHHLSLFLPSKRFYKLPTSIMIICRNVLVLKSAYSFKLMGFPLSSLKHNFDITFGSFFSSISPSQRLHLFFNTYTFFKQA